MPPSAEPAPPATAVRRLARALGQRLDALRRDAAMVRRSLVGSPPSPFVSRKPSVHTEREASAALAPRSMRVARVVRETADAVTLVLEDPTGAPVRFVAGQFFTLLASVDGEALRRAYSASSSALDPSRVELTIKRVAGGKVSGFVVDGIREGETIELLGPSGSFTFTPDPTAQRHVVLVGGGSGITPLMSIARTLLAAEPRSFVSLVYGNRREDDVIFRDALAALAAEHAERFARVDVLSEPPPGWTGATGMLERDVVARQLDVVDVHAELPAEFYVCGPEPMMRAAREAILARGVDPSRIHEERFASPHLRAASSTPLDAQTVTARMRDGERRFVVAAGQTILEAGLAAGAPMPFSCAMGGCGACKVKLADGEVDMEEPSCLTDEERAAGYVLACVSRPKCAAVVEVP